MSKAPTGKTGSFQFLRSTPNFGLVVDWVVEPASSQRLTLDMKMISMRQSNAGSFLEIVSELLSVALRSFVGRKMSVAALTLPALISTPPRQRPIFETGVVAS